ncbi:MAG: Hsp20/alpha crystallin family protein [Promethearchaeota archaeon]
MGEDIFEFGRKHFKKMFDDWTLFDDDMDDFFSNFDENFQINLNNPESKGYSMSYHYETGMKEPEIKIQGDPDEKTVDTFLKGIQKRFGHHLAKIGNNKIKKLNMPKNEEKESDGIHTFTIEMPGIGKEDINTEIKNQILTIEGKKGEIYYKKKFHLNFKPKEKPEIKADNGLITITVKEK